MTSMIASLREPFPSRKAHEALRQRLEEQLMSGTYAEGDKFASDAELVKNCGLSRETVRRALTQLSRDGWIERRHGLGTFVGPRVNMPFYRRTEQAAERKKSMGRVAVLGTWFWRPNIGWYSAGIFEGMEEAAGEAGISIELLGNHASDPLAARRRLAQTRPDVLVCLLARNQHALFIAEAQRLNIPALVTGSRLADIGVPSVCEDGEQGARLAVERLIAAGHKRIGLLAWTEGGPWIFERRRGYCKALEAAGIEPDERLTLWLDRVEQQTPSLENAQAIQRYYEKQRPTAIVSTASGITFDLVPLVRSGVLRVPQDLSIVQFDQTFDFPVPEFPMMTSVALPVREIGRELAKLSRKIINGEDVGIIAPIPCTLVEGGTVAGPAGR